MVPFHESQILCFVFFLLLFQFVSYLSICLSVFKFYLSGFFFQFTSKLVTIYIPIFFFKYSHIFSQIAHLICTYLAFLYVL